ncbi:MAG: 1-deoxy-D-xylulose-5-phosphate synthase [Planctomycetota bacterium]|nr:1-deoxy-D-xylulose-5-phosphate synthase [Planctomycetota bacterium]
MRKAFAATLVELAEQDPRIILMTGDLGYMVLEPFMEKFPERFINVGVAEQNMVGLATGLADAGFIPFVYSIIPFATLRPFEFIRNGPIVHQLPVRIVGVGSGFDYGHNGVSHYGLEDVGIMRTQPGITIIAPADHLQTTEALKATWDLPSPIYFRLGKDDKTVVPGLAGRFEMGRLQRLGNGSDLLLVTIGNIVPEVVNAADKLRTSGVSCSVAVISSLNPSPDADLIELLREFTLVMTVEAHYTNGGIGSYVSEIIAEKNLPCRIVRCGVDKMPDGVTGSQGYLRQKHGLSAAALLKTALAELAIGGADE